MTIGLLAGLLSCMRAVVFLIFFVSRPAALPPQKGQTRLRAMSIGKALARTLRAARRWGFSLYRQVNRIFFSGGPHVEESARRRFQPCRPRGRRYRRGAGLLWPPVRFRADRKSTRLNSSH